jgi:hypothetical protein
MKSSPQKPQLELFAGPYDAHLPRQGTQADAALASLLENGRLRQTDWLPGNWRLAAAIHALKKLGWPIKSVRVYVQGRQRKVAEYSLVSGGHV